MDSSRRLALAKALKARTKATSAKAGASDTPMTEKTLLEPPQSPTSPHTAQTTNSSYTLQTPNSPPPIVAVPLAVANTPTPAPLDKGKGVLTIPYDDEGSDKGHAFKRRRTNRVISSRSASPQRGGSLRETPLAPHHHLNNRAKRRGQNPLHHQRKHLLHKPLPHRS